ncbi:hypothetical protein Q1695_005465 [Nippostrongylus brasiliensis]|nr:hypothetical protein Q1695_005465 [Nippostrongylus brasiliensis]
MKPFVVLIVVVLTLLCSQARGSSCAENENDKMRCKRSPPQMTRRLLVRKCWQDGKGNERCYTREQLQKMNGN